MSKAELRNIMMAIQCYYPNWKPTVEPQFLLDSWYLVLKDVPYDKASMALQRYVTTDTTGFAPSVGVLRNIVVENENPAELGELEAWAIVRKAIGNSAYHYNSEFAKLPPILKRVVGQPINLYHWSQMDSETIGSVEQSHFLKAYRSALIQEKEYKAMPEGIRDLVALPDCSLNTVAQIEEKTEEKVLATDSKLDAIKAQIEKIRQGV